MANCNNITKTEREALVRWNEFIDSTSELPKDEAFASGRFLEELRNLSEFGPEGVASEILGHLKNTIAEVMSLREGGNHA